MEEKTKFYTFMLLVAITSILLFVLIEINNPYNFTKDDNFAQFLPNILEGYKQIFSLDFPSINMHQYTGSVLFETGTYAYFYPPLFVSYFLSHYIFYNDFLTLEIFALIHLILGSIFSFMLFYKRKINYAVSFMASIAIAFSGYVLIASSNWYYVFPTIVFLPIIIILDDYLMTLPSRWPLIILGITRGIYFYSGNSQYFFFTLIFEIIYLALKLYRMKEKDLARNIEKYILSILITLIIALPLILGQLNVVENSPRGSVSFISYIFSLPSSIIDIIKGFILPYPLVESHSPFGYSGPGFIEIYYSGFIFSLAFLIGGAYYLINLRKNSLKSIPQTLWLAIISIILSLGYFGLLYLAGSFLPVVKNFSNPFKLTIFTQFFTICFGAMILSKVIDKIKDRRKLYLLTVSILTIIFLALMSYHAVTSSKVAWSYYGDDLPLDTTKYESIIHNDFRVISLFSNSSLDPRYIKSSNYTSNFDHSMFLTQSFATYYGIDHLGGYEPFIDKLTREKISFDRFGVTNSKLNLTTLGEYGVKYIFLPSDSLDANKELKALSIVYQDRDLTIYEIDDPKHYVFAGDKNLEYERRNDGLLFYTYFNSSENVTVNLLYKEDFKATINGEETEIYVDQLGRMMIKVGAGAQEVEIYYFPSSLVKGLVIAIILLIALITYSLFFRTNGIKGLDKLFKKLQNIKYTKKIKIIILLAALAVIIIFVIAIVGNVLKGTSITEVVKERTNIDLSIGDTSFNILKLEYNLENFTRYSKDGEIAMHVDKAHVQLGLISSFKESLNRYRPSAVFDEVLIENLTFYLKENSDSQFVCNNPVSIYVDEKSEEYYNFDSVEIENIIFIPLNKAYLSIESEGIYANLSVEKYVFGEILLNQTDDVNKIERCIVLPLEDYNLIYYN